MTRRPRTSASWSMPDSNRRPSACKADALPAAPIPRRPGTKAEKRWENTFVPEHIRRSASTQPDPSHGRGVSFYLCLRTVHVRAPIARTRSRELPFRSGLDHGNGRLNRIRRLASLIIGLAWNKHRAYRSRPGIEPGDAHQAHRPPDRGLSHEARVRKTTKTSHDPHAV